MNDFKILYSQKNVFRILLLNIKISQVNGYISIIYLFAINTGVCIKLHAKDIVIIDYLHKGHTVTGV